MDGLRSEQRAFAIKAFYKNNITSVKVARRELRHYFTLERYNHVPSARPIKTWIRNFEKIVPAMKNKPPGQLRTARTPEYSQVV